MADDLVLSAQPPLLTENGMIRPVRRDDGWYYQDKLVSLSYPSCDMVTQIGHGAMIGSALLLLIIVAFGFRFASKMVVDLFSVGGSDDN